MSLTPVTRLTSRSGHLSGERGGDLCAERRDDGVHRAQAEQPALRGSAPARQPGVTTFIDGVPQLNANSSSIELVDVQQIEFVRGPQGALYGRNTLAV